MPRKWPRDWVSCDYGKTYSGEEETEDSPHRINGEDKQLFPYPRSISRSRRFFKVGRIIAMFSEEPNCDRSSTSAYSNVRRYIIVGQDERSCSVLPISFWPCDVAELRGRHKTQWPIRDPPGLERQGDPIADISAPYENAVDEEEHVLGPAPVFRRLQDIRRSVSLRGDWVRMPACATQASTNGRASELRRVSRGPEDQMSWEGQYPKKEPGHEIQRNRQQTLQPDAGQGRRKNQLVVSGLLAAGWVPAVIISNYGRAHGQEIGTDKWLPPPYSALRSADDSLIEANGHLLSWTFDPSPLLFLAASNSFGLIMASIWRLNHDQKWQKPLIVLSVLVTVSVGFVLGIPIMGTALQVLPWVVYVITVCCEIWIGGSRFVKSQVSYGVTCEVHRDLEDPEPKEKKQET